ncbi:MAG: electron transfer flavoprotein subunit beta/FixA family protein [Bacteroidota bacterium]
MKILIAISHVPDTTTKIQFDESGSGINRTGVSFVINPYDEYGLSRALGFREEGKQVNITVLTVGGPEVEPTLRKALAIGADDAVRINADATDAYIVAKHIADYAEPREYDIIFTGKESIDFNGSMVPGMVAEMLDWPFVSFATHMEMTGDTSAMLKREVDGGVEVIETSLPVMVSCQKGIAEWRIPNMRGIMAARKKPLSVVNVDETAPQVATLNFNYPPAKGDTVYIESDNAGQLIQTLSEKGII